MMSKVIFFALSFLMITTLGAHIPLTAVPVPEQETGCQSPAGTCQAGASGGKCEFVSAKAATSSCPSALKVEVPQCDGSSKSLCVKCKETVSCSGGINNQCQAYARTTSENCPGSFTKKKWTADCICDWPTH